jgi:glutaconate CoA-transferase subunit B
MTFKDTLAYTLDELFVVCVARQVEDNTIWAQGINTPLIMAGLMLAKRTHAPNIRFVSAIGQGISDQFAPLSLTHIEDVWMRHALLHVSFAQGVSELLPTYQPREFFRPAQVDAQGNTNNIAIGRNYQQPRMRLPGTGGIPDVSVQYDHIYLYVTRHSKITFRENIDYVSGLGHVKQRQRGSGACYLISDLGQFDWANDKMRLTSYHATTTLETIQKRTGFPLEIASDCAPTVAPTEEELRLLRHEVDPLSIRKLELLAGQARRQHLRDILTTESQ